MTASPPPSLRPIAAAVEARLADLLGSERARWTAFDPQLDDAFASIERLVLGGGKRLRPVFCHWGFVGAGGDPDAGTAVDAGAAIELMHAFALFHDDVIDDADTRRGAPTTHVLAAAEHARHGWAGDARRYGDGVAILIGDLAFVYSDELLCGASREAWSIWNELRIELNVGQYLDVVGSVQRRRDRALAERICRYKSGKYTIERPLHLGAVLAAPDAASELLPSLSAYGLPLGDAFQMRDDVMGAFGDSTATGKPVGGDLIEGKPTPLLARAYEAADGTQRQILDLVGRPGLTPDRVAAIQQVIIDTGALADLEAHIDALAIEAVDSLGHAPITSPAKAELEALADYVTARAN